MVIIAKDQVHEPLWTIVPHFNPFRLKSRVKHAERALKHFHDSGAVIIFVEIGFNRRDLVFADSGLDGKLAECGITDNQFRHKYIGLHTKDELWLKENAINLGAQHIPHAFFNQLCWLDSDVHFVRPNWVGECIHKLQHGTTSDRAFVQMFSHARDLGPNYEMLDEDYPHANGLGFVEAWHRGHIHSSHNPIIEMDVRELRKDTSTFEKDFKRDMDRQAQDIAKLEADVEKLKHDFEYPPYGQHRVFPGLAWACTRPAWEAVGGLFDAAIWGGGDWHMSHALIEKTENMMLPTLHRNYKKLVNQWYQRCRTHIRRNVLVMEGSILHHWHGKKIGRGYNAKHQLLSKVGFDPLRHLTRDYQGLWALHDDRSSAYVQLRDELRRIARERNEDSSDI